MRPHWIKARNGTAEGDLTCEAGHRLVRPDGSIDGIYARWRWTGGGIEIEQDRYGFFPLFEWRTGEMRMVSTDLATLIERGAPTDLDRDAIAVFLRVGFFVGADTPFAAVRAVLPPPLPPVRHELSRSAAVEGFIDLFGDAIARRQPSAPYELPLSGGRDSRHILFALCQAGAPPAACVTIRHFAPRANDDELIARQLCERLQIPHRVLPQPPDRAAIEGRKNAATHVCSDEHGQFMVLSDHLRAHTRETYDGIAGDVLSQSSYLTPAAHARLDARDTAGFARYVLDGYGTMTDERALATVLTPDIYRALPRERALVRLEREIAPHLESPNPAAAFFFANRTRREVALAPYGLMRDLLVYAPYLDTALYDFLAGLPATMLMDRTFHTEAIARGWPQYADVPYERKGTATRDARGGRSLARALGRVLLRRDIRQWMQPSALAPGIAATAVDGRAERLWHAPLLLYLASLMDVVAGATSTPRE